MISVFSTEGTLISASPVPHCGMEQRMEQKVGTDRGRSTKTKQQQNKNVEADMIVVYKR